MVTVYTPEMLADKIEDLPLVDAGAIEILTLLNDPESNFNQIVDKLSPDVAARFLNMANNAYYGRVVRSINYAVTLLGYENMKQILVSAFLMDHFTKRLGLKNFSFEIFQKQSHFCAEISRILAEIIDYQNPEDLFTVATLYNIGKLIIAVYFEVEHQEIIALKKKEGISTSDAEKQIIGVTHAEIGALTLQRFKIPPDICDAVRYHNSRNRIPSTDFDFQLEFISRQAAMIVHEFSIPDEGEFQHIRDQLQEIITEGRNVYRQTVTMNFGTDEYLQTFTSLLDQAAAMVAEKLKAIWEVRELWAHAKTHSS